MLDQLDLLDEMNQIGVVGRTSVTFKDGQRVTSRGWHGMFAEMGETYLDYLLNIRQKLSMDVFRRRYEQLQGRIETGWTLKEMELNDNDLEDHRVTSTIHNEASESRKIVRR